MARSRPMNVLLQGDVGAGKTLVALHAALVAIGSGHQAAIMAPDRGARRPAPALGRRRCSSPSGPCRTSSSRRRAARTGQASLLDAGRRAGGAAALTYALLTGAVTGKDRAADPRGRRRTARSTS